MTMILWFVAGFIAGGVLIWVMARGRSQELRKATEEARTRETEAKDKVASTEVRYSQLAVEYRTVVEEKGKYQAEAARVDEIKTVLAKRDDELKGWAERFANLDREKTEAMKDSEAANKRTDEMVAKEREKTEAIVKAKDEQIDKLNEFIAQARGVLTAEFKALSGDVLRDVSGQLVKAADELIKVHGDQSTGAVALHKQQIETMLKPVEETIKRLDQHVADSDLARARAEALLDEQVRRLAGASESLSNALRKPAVRGSWGEMTLENALENAGLRAEIDFQLQHTTDSEDGRKRTDAIINLPKGKKLIIDSKNLMESYISLANAESDTQKAVLAQAHSKSLRGHISDLSSQEYWRRYEGLDCVILFIPHDGMYHAAIHDESELIRKACEKRVFITNPMSLIPLLKAVAYVLDQERLNKNAETIKKVGSELYFQIGRFAENMAIIGSKLQSTVKAYNDAIPGLDRYIIANSRTLKKLGAGKGADAKIPEAIELEPRLFAAPELRASNSFFDRSDDFDLAASAGPGSEGD